MNERQMKAAVDGIELAISKREVELERLKTKRDAMRWREGASVEIERLTGERNEARAEVERLTKERDEAREQAKSLRNGLHRAMRGYFSLAEFVLSGEYADEARRMAEEFQALVRPDLYDVEEMIPAAHAEKVLVSVAKAAARLGAEEMREKCIALAKKEEQLAREQSERPHANKYGRFDYWDGRRAVCRALAKWIGNLSIFGDEP